MILIVTNRQDYTADFLILELQRRKAEYTRLNTEDFPSRVQIAWEMSSDRIDGYFRFPKKRINFTEISSVWYRRPVAPVPDFRITDTEDRSYVKDESIAALDGLWSALDCLWVSQPNNIRAAEVKLSQLKIARQLGFSVPRTIVTNNPSSARGFIRSLEGGVVYKPLRHGKLIRGENVSLIYTSPVDARSANRLSQVRFAPTLLQQQISKQVDIRATVIGSKVFAVEIHSQAHPEAVYDWRRGNLEDIKHTIHALPPALADKCVSLAKELGLNFGAIDLIQTTDEEYIFLEINPNGQWAWIQQLIPNLPLRETLAELLISGSNRLV